MALVFIDGNHDYFHVKEDYKNLEAKMTKHSIPVGHDYHSNVPGVVKAVDDLLKEQFFVGQDNVWAQIIS